MSITLELPPEAEAILREESLRKGMPVETLASTVLISYLTPSTSVAPGEGEDVFQKRIAAWESLGNVIVSNGMRQKPFQDEVDLGMSRADFYGYTEREDA